MTRLAKYTIKQTAKHCVTDDRQIPGAVAQRHSVVPGPPLFLLVDHQDPLGYLIVGVPVTMRHDGPLEPSEHQNSLVGPIMLLEGSHHMRDCLGEVDW